MPLPLDHVPLLHQDAVLNADEEVPRNWAAQWTSEWSEPTAVTVRRAVKSRTGTGKFVDTGTAGRIVVERAGSVRTEGRPPNGPAMCT
ncbi:hypothetical protein BOG92_004305 [Streptomyces sp. WAC00263]|nr:hypothetical protein BOG92_004305 [Streptomyces sp. WAC00263]